MARWIRAALELDGEFTVRFVDEEEGRELNHQFRRKDYATNVLTFDYQREPVVMADIVICPAVLERQAAEQQKTAARPFGSSSHSWRAACAGLRPSGR